MSLDTLAFCSQKIQLDQSCKIFVVFFFFWKTHWFCTVRGAYGARERIRFPFFIISQIDPPLRSVAVREARAKRATTACCGGEIFFFGGFFCKNKILLISKILLFSWRILRALRILVSIFFFLPPENSCF